MILVIFHSFTELIQLTDYRINNKEEQYKYNIKYPKLTTRLHSE